MRAGMFASTAILIGLLASGHALAASTLVLTTTSGHPGSAAAFKGAGFGDGEAVDIYVDTVDTALLASSSTGTFSGSVTLPTTTQPGPHYITAIGRHSGDAAQAPFTVTTPWSEFGFGAAHFGWNPYENTLDVDAVRTLGPLYAYASGAEASSPAVANGRVIIGTESGLGVAALSTTTGSLLWKAQTAAMFDVSPALAYNFVYAGSMKGTMYALTATSGKTVWATAGGGAFESSPVVSGGTVYVGCDDQKLYAFAAETTTQAAGGKILWKYATGGEVLSAPAVFNNTVFFGSGDNKVYAVSTAGTLEWSYTTGDPVYGSPSVAYGLVYVGSDDDTLYALDADNGALAWSVTTGGPILSSPAVADGVVYVGSDDGNLYAFNAHSGNLQWSVSLGGPIGVASPTVADGVVYIAPLSGTLYAIQATTGAILWTFATSYGGYSNAAISDGMVYFDSADGNTYAFAAGAGANAVRRRAHAPAISTLRPDLTLRVTE